MSQRIDVSNLVGQIDDGELGFLLSAWLGGFSVQADSATVIARFLNGSGSEIGASQLDPVTAADRGNVTGFVLRRELGLVPPTTRYVDIELTATAAVGDNDAYADNISFVLIEPSTSPDINGDGVVFGDGTGPYESDDVTAFVSYWRLSAPPTSPLPADLNLDGIVDLGDWAILNSVDPAMAQAVAATLRSSVVPEPATLVLALIGAMVAVSLRRTTAIPRSAA